MSGLELGIFFLFAILCGLMIVLWSEIVRAKKNLLAADDKLFRLEREWRDTLTKVSTLHNSANDELSRISAKVAAVQPPRPRDLKVGNFHETARRGTTADL